MSAKLVSPFLAGALFGVGLILGGMTQPEKVIAFLDFFSSAWDPSLAFVMGGALLVFGPLQARVRAQRDSPLFARIFQIPDRTDIDGRLVLGSALFGVGWGLGGYCPGPALTSVVSGVPALLFLGSMVVGMMLQSLLSGRGRPSANRPPPSEGVTRPQTDG